MNGTTTYVVRQGGGEVVAVCERESDADAMVRWLNTVAPDKWPYYSDEVALCRDKREALETASLEADCRVALAGLVA